MGMDFWKPLGPRKAVWVRHGGPSLGGTRHVKGSQRPLGWALAPGTALSLYLTVGGLVLGPPWRDGQGS